MPQIDPVLARRIASTIAEEIGAQPAQAQAAIGLLDEGATVPFIARYRKEVTGGLDDIQLRALETRLSYLRELEDRRAAVLASIDEQGKLSDELRADIEAADSKARLEDLYLPYKPKRRTRAQIAREAGLEPLADALLADPSQVPEAAAAAHVDADKGVADTTAALEGARAIVMERWGEDAALVGGLRSWLHEVGVIRARVVDGKQDAGAKYRDYFDHAEALARIPSHRLLALFRARREEFITLDLDPGTDAEAGHAQAEGVEDIKDLKPGMVLEGVVSNVAAFGAFVDIGVHQDGLVHISALSDRYVKDPREVVKAGDVVKVRVLEVDVARKRIALTRRLDDAVPPAGAANTAGESRGSRGPRDSRDARGNGGRPGAARGAGGNPTPRPGSAAPPANNALAAAFAKARKS